jgi:hypothetical protein
MGESAAVDRDEGVERMDATSPKSADMEGRIKGLERETRGLKVFAVVLLGLVLILTYRDFGFERYRILDENGALHVLDELEMPRARLDASAYTSGLTLYDRMDRDRAALSATQEGSGLVLRDQNAFKRIILRTNDDGSQLLLTDARERIRAALYVGEEGPKLRFWDEEGVVVFDSSLIPADPGVTEQGNSGVVAP